MAQKKLPKRLTRQWNLRVSAQELSDLRLAASRHGVTVSEYVRHLIAQAAKRAGIAA